MPPNCVLFYLFIPIRRLPRRAASIELRATIKVPIFCVSKRKFTLRDIQTTTRLSWLGYQPKTSRRKFDTEDKTALSSSSCTLDTSKYESNPPAKPSYVSIIIAGASLQDASKGSFCTPELFFSSQCKLQLQLCCANNFQVKAAQSCIKLQQLSQEPA